MDQLKEKAKAAQAAVEKSLDKVDLKETAKRAGDKLSELGGQLKGKDDSPKKKKKEIKEINSFHRSIDKVEEKLHIDIPEGEWSSDDEDEEDGLLGGVRDEFAKLSLKQRLLGAIVCFAFSGLLAFTATVLLVTGVRRHVRWYALFYVLSSVITFSSLLFVLGLKRLQKRMLNANRHKSGKIWIGSLGLALFFALFWPSHWFIIIVLLIVQGVSMIWYGATFVPYARKFIKKYAAYRIVTDGSDSDDDHRRKK